MTKFNTPFKVWKNPLPPPNWLKNIYNPQHFPDPLADQEGGPTSIKGTQKKSQSCKAGGHSSITAQVIVQVPQRSTFKTSDSSHTPS